MSRPLLITDCDEVLLHMVAHFDAWLAEAKGIDFAFETGDFGGSMTRHGSGDAVPKEEVMPLLGDFFEQEMHRQTLVPGALEALGRIGEIADIVILTNIPDAAHPWRVAQLAGHGIRHEVMCNRGGKGPPAAELIARYGAPRAAFVDDLAVHHRSVADHAPETWRLHMVAEPRLAPAVADAEHAHARIDHWERALPWLLERLEDQ
ncbi:HAD family hydrolase [Sphingomicrobium nitratireducens]|uniref:HAD family hydrolase n=1 Tax=Sphingomicrobium nitratireducens TaxID=2964666 RepID=UPI002240610B|nr:HAD family hydrolase [Sphingomicrobium nitratireducens]